MADKTSIEWAEATWNPLVGCTKVSPGCDHCYAENLVNRFAGTGAAFPTRFDTVTIRDDKFLTQPLRWKKPRRIFVNSLSDLFHADVPDEFVARVFAVMAEAEAPQHTFQLLTKRHARMRSLLSDPDGRFQSMIGAERYHLGNHDEPSTSDRSWGWPLPNVHLGVSVENQQWATIRGDALRETPAAIRFFSAEPLLGPIETDLTGIDWIIVGGESGRRARPMHPDWARSLRDQCQAAGVPFLFKQWGEHVTEDQSPEDITLPATCWYLLDDRTCFYRVGKHAPAERDGRTWDEYPRTTPAADVLDAPATCQVHFTPTAVQQIDCGRPGTHIATNGVNVYTICCGCHAFLAVKAPGELMFW